MNEVGNFGERALPEGYEDQPWGRLLRYLQLESYERILDTIEGKRVLEVGCGPGYGTARMAEVAAEVVGTDISDEAVQYCQAQYGAGPLADKLTFQKIRPPESSPLPFADESFDAVVSYQVIEHVQDDQRFLKELHRVLKPGGSIFITTPDRDYRLFPFQKPWNAFHLREYSDSQLRAQMQPFFGDIRVLHMGSRDSVARPEKDRARKIRWLTLPFTLPFVPEAVRQPVLLWLMERNQKQKVGQRSNGSSITFDRSAIEVGERGASVPNSMNLLAIATKR